jgi:putative tryptophan/tyrosine transport system substrate-binding protein
MNRRAFIGLLGAAATWPSALRADSAERMRLIGVVLTAAANDPVAQARVKAFAQGLGEHGWRAGENIAVEYRFANGDADRMRALTQELLDLQAEVIITNGVPPISVVWQQNPRIPIVFAAMADPLGAGLLKDQSRPDTNITGFSTFEYSIVGKWLELLKAVAPDITRVGLMFDPGAAYRDGSHWLKQFRGAASSFAVDPIELPVRNVGELELVATEFAVDHNGGLLVVSDTFTSAHHAEIAAVAARHRIPGCYGFRYFATDGGLMSYGPDSADLYRRSASYVSRILRGEKAADLPVQLPTKFELIINLKTANSMGLTVPTRLLARADEVIE